MEVIECDRCKKRIGEKHEAETTPVKVGKGETKAVCAECSEKLEQFMAGKDDMRTAFTQISREEVAKTLAEIWNMQKELSTDEAAALIIERLPNGGRF